jgi:hypothetical protein
MPVVIRSRWRALPVQMALALLGCGGVSAADARAECGDYVQILGGGAAPMAGHPGPLAPCHGRECSRPDHPLAPPAAPAPPASSPTQLDALLTPADPPDPSRSAAVGSEPVTLPAIIPTSIFRPPRSR